MSTVVHLRVVAILFLIYTTTLSAPTKKDGRNQLLLIMLDGFRWDYVDQQSSTTLPGFNKLLQEGIRAKWVEPIFPSNSFPSWNTIVTGLYPESHGLVSNFFYDKGRDKYFNMYDWPTTGDPAWYTSVPIWITATENNCNVALFLWSRCAIEVKGITPKYCEEYVNSPGWRSLDANLQKALSKLKEGYDLVQVYNQYIDDVGHKYGPDSSRMKQAVREIDQVLNHFLFKLEEEELAEKVNIIIVSDHGMTSTSLSHTTYLSFDDFIDVNDIQIILDRGSYANIVPRPGKRQKVYNDLKRMPGVKVLFKEEIPEEYHHKNSPFVHDIIVIATKGVFIKGTQTVSLPVDKPSLEWEGFHGYDNTVSDMRALFVAKGPDFKSSHIQDPIHLVDIYKTMAYVLQIPEEPNNGSWLRIKDMFVEDTTTPLIKIDWPFLVLSCILAKMCALYSHYNIFCQIL